MTSPHVEMGSLVFTSEELTLLADVAELTPLFSWNVSELDEDGWDAVYRGLRARGVLVRSSDPDGGVSIAEHLRAILGIAFLARRATTISSGQGHAVTTRTVLCVQPLGAGEARQLLAAAVG